MFNKLAAALTLFFGGGAIAVNLAGLIPNSGANYQASWLVVIVMSVLVITSLVYLLADKPQK